jgi:hypothetical protein
MTTNILEQLARRKGQFLPANPRHLLALRIASFLGGLEELTRFVVLSEHYPKELLLKAYGRAKQSDSPTEAFFVFFQAINQSPE